MCRKRKMCFQIRIIWYVSIFLKRATNLILIIYHGDYYKVIKGCHFCRKKHITVELELVHGFGSDLGLESRNSEHERLVQYYRYKEHKNSILLILNRMKTNQ